MKDRAWVTVSRFCAVVTSLISNLDQIAAGQAPSSNLYYQRVKCCGGLPHQLATSECRAQQLVRNGQWASAKLLLLKGLTRGIIYLRMKSSQAARARRRLSRGIKGAVDAMCFSAHGDQVAAIVTLSARGFAYSAVAEIVHALTQSVSTLHRERSAHSNDAPCAPDDNNNTLSTLLCKAPGFGGAYEDCGLCSTLYDYSTCCSASNPLGCMETFVINEPDCAEWVGYISSVTEMILPATSSAMSGSTVLAITTSTAPDVQSMETSSSTEMLSTNVLSTQSAIAISTTNPVAIGTTSTAVPTGEPGVTASSEAASSGTAAGATPSGFATANMQPNANCVPQLATAYGRAPRLNETLALQRDEKVKGGREFLAKVWKGEYVEYESEGRCRIA
nr:hypothetical protein CFP56_22577 [Quercus suber]